MNKLLLSLALIAVCAMPACVPFAIKRSPERIQVLDVAPPSPPPPSECLKRCPPLPLDTATNEAEDEDAVDGIIAEYERCQLRHCACIQHLAPGSDDDKFCEALPGAK